MMIPIRCFSCGKPLADKWDDYKNAIANGTTEAAALTQLGIERLCCRRMFLSQDELTEEIKKYPRF